MDVLLPVRGLQGRLVGSLRAVGALLVVAMSFDAGAARSEQIQVPAADAYISGGANVIDGDTLEIGGNSIRLADIDAPPLNYVCQDRSGTTVPCGQRAALYLRELIGLSTVTCIPIGRDSYTREVARCSVRGTDLGGTMVRAGWAIARYGKGYEPEEADAKARGAGLWAFAGATGFAPSAPQKP